jgi:NTP pyrophosphatase (non-canonical NTP hydrolase)
LDMNVYQDKALGTATYPNVGSNMVYPALGLAGEAGEVAEKVKKLWRNHGTMDGKSTTPEQSKEIAKEIGDVLWYCAALSKEIGITLGSIALGNIEKLQDRAARGAIKSEGDNR